MLFFDEATSALDNTTQALVTQGLQALRATRVVVAHRLSTIAGANRVVVLEAGRVVQQGSYAELAEQDGRLSSLLSWPRNDPASGPG